MAGFTVAEDLMQKPGFSHVLLANTHQTIHWWFSTCTFFHPENFELLDFYKLASLTALWIWRGALASNPGPHRHRICDRREEGLAMVKPPFCVRFPSQNSEPRVPFSSLFLTAKNVEVSPGAGWSCQGTNTGQIPAWGSSTPQHAQKRRRGKDEDFLVQKSLTLWPPKFTVRSERNAFPSSFSCFLFFLSHVFLSGKTQSPALREQHQFCTRGVGQAWPWAAWTVRKKGCIMIFSPNNASAPKGVPCRRCALFVIMATKLNKPSNCIRSFPCQMLVWLSSSTWQVKSLLRKTWQTYRQRYNHNDCTNNF